MPEIVWSVRSTSVPSATAAPPAGGVIVTRIGLEPSVIGLFFCVSTGWFPNAIAPYVAWSAKYVAVRRRPTR